MSVRAAATSPAAARGEKGSRPRLSGRAAILLFLVFVIAMFAIAPTRAWFHHRAHLRELEQQATSLEAANAALEARVDDLRDPRTLERLARECLGMVEPGEIAIITIPRGTAPHPPTC